MPNYNYGADIAAGRELSASPKIFTGLIEREQSLRAAKERAQSLAGKEKLIDWKDFKSDNKDLYPYYARQDAEATANSIKKIFQYEQQGLSQTAATNMYLMKDAPLLQEQRDQIRKSNENVKTILNKEGIYVDPALKEKVNRLAMSADTTADQWEKELHNDGEGVYAKNGMFGTPILKDYDFQKDIKEYAAKSEGAIDPNEKPVVTPLPNGGWTYTRKLHPTREAADTMADEILSDKEKDNLFIKKYGIKVPSTGDQEADQALLKTEVSKKIYDMFPKTFNETKTVPPIPQSKQTSKDGNSYTHGDVRYDWNVSPVNGYKTVTVHPAKITAKIQEDTWIDGQGKPFKGVIQSLGRPDGSDKTDIYVTKTFKPDDKNVIRVNKITGQQYKNDDIVPETEKDQVVVLSNVKDPQEITIQVPERAENISNAKKGGVTFDDLEKVFKGKTQGTQNVGGGIKSTKTSTTGGKGEPVKTDIPKTPAPKGTTSIMAKNDAGVMTEYHVPNEKVDAFKKAKGLNKQTTTTQQAKVTPKNISNNEPIATPEREVKLKGVWDRIKSNTELIKLYPDYISMKKAFLNARDAKSFDEMTDKDFDKAIADWTK